jgi:hypothetical protein
MQPVRLVIADVDGTMACGVSEDASRSSWSGSC